MVELGRVSLEMWHRQGLFSTPWIILKHMWVTAGNILIIKPNKCTNFSNLFSELNFTCFGQFLCPSSGIFHCTHSNGICHTGLLTACEQDQDGTAVPRKLSANLYDIYHCCVYNEKFLMMDRGTDRNM